MRRPRLKFLLMLLVFLLGSVFMSPAFSGTKGKAPKEAEPASMVIKSKTLEMNDKNKTVIFTGNVKATRSDFVITCQKLIVFYKSLPGEKDTGKSETKIEKIVATGKVRINRGQGGVATAEKAVYYQQEEKVVLTVNPVVQRGNDFIEGDRITIFLKDNRSIVESSGDKEVRAVIFPKREKR